MAYGSVTYRKNYSRSYRRSRFGTRNSIARPYAKKATRRTRYVRRPAFAVSGYVKDSEKKYSDSVRVGSNWITQIIAYETVPGTPGSSVVQGVKFMSDLKGASGTNASQNLLSGIPVGAEADKRVGNKIYARWLDLGLTLEAAKSPVEQYGEQVNVEGGVATAQYYMKTNFRIVIVKDKQVNNTTNTILWGDVFGLGLNGTDSGTFASNDKLDIPNMGRFEIVKDVRCTVDAESPLKTLQMGCVPGSIRYNSGLASSLASKGYYVLIGQDVLGTATSASFVIAGNVRVSSRLTFTDN